MRNVTTTLALACVLTLAAAIPALAQETDPLAVMQSEASFKDKAAACRALARTGGPEAVPVLAPLLLDAKLSHLARHALEPMPYPEAGAAIRDALGKTTGRLQVGMVNSCAIREDAQAIPAIIGLLSSGDILIVQAAARALGTMATPEAVKALTDAVSKADVAPLHLRAYCEGLFKAAEKLAKAKQSDKAIAIYDHLLKASGDLPQIHTAALRGAVLTRGAEKGLTLLVQALGSEDKRGFAAALRTARELEANEKVTAALTAALPGLSAPRKISLLQALGHRGDTAAGPAVLALAKEGEPEVRIAALRTLTRIGYAPALALMVQLISADDEELAEAARDLLSHFPGQERVAALKGMLKSDQPATRCIAIELIGQGGLDEPADILMGLAEADADEGVRVAALDTLENSAGLKELPRLVGVLLKGRSESEQQSAETALEALAERQKGKADNDVAIQKALYGALPDGKQADVTKKVAEMVKAGASSVGALNTNFGDPTPGISKALRVDYTAHGVSASKTVLEGQTLVLTTAFVPPVIVDALCAALSKSQGEATFAVLRLLGATGSPKALDTVCATASKADGAVKKTALEVLCDWPNADALPTIVDVLCAELDKAQGDAKVPVLQMLGGTGTPKALDTVRATAAQADGAAKKAALRTLCDWPNTAALPFLMELVRTSPDQTLKVLAFGGSVRLLKESKAGVPAVLKQYAELMTLAPGADEKRLVLSGLAQIRTAESIAAILAQLGDENVKAEAVQAALAIVRERGKRPTPEKKLFNGKDLAGWTATTNYWKVEDGAIVGASAEQIPATAYLWSNVQAANFYFSAEVKLTPATANSGVQFRSKTINEAGQALGLQGDIGKDVWGRLYHQGGRGKLDWNGRAESAVKPEEWNRFEILAVGPAIWTAINGKLGVACLDTEVAKAPSGAFAFQLHQGAPQTVRYRNLSLVHNPPVEIAGMKAEQLLAELKIP